MAEEVALELRDRMAEAAAAIDLMGGLEQFCENRGLTRDEWKEIVKDACAIPVQGEADRIQREALLAIGYMIGEDKTC